MTSRDYSKMRSLNTNCRNYLMVPRLLHSILIALEYLLYG